MASKDKPKFVDPWSVTPATNDGKIKEEARDLSISPVSNRQMIEVFIGPAKGPKIRAMCRPEDRMCLPRVKQEYKF